METRLTPTPSPEPRPVDFPDADELAMLRTWYAGMPVRKAVERYLSDRVGPERSARGVLGGIRRKLVKASTDLAAILGLPDREHLREAKTTVEAIELFRYAHADSADQ